jgi:Ca2+:H+ antiporter
MSVAEAPTSARPGRFLLTGQGWPYLLVPFIPLAVV